MLLRLRIEGFKNLAKADIRFGPVTCFVGPNGVGKSNIFDAMQFLKLLSEHEIQDAASRVRRPTHGSHGPLDLFYGGDPNRSIVLEADLLVPRDVKDDFDREGRASTTLLTYRVAFRYSAQPMPRLELVEESLTHRKKGQAEDFIGFPHGKAFRTSTVQGVRRGGPLISTTHDGGTPEIRLHQDGGSRGQPFPPGRSPRTVLGGTNTYEFPTVLAARREMASWQFLHLEPSAMRTPDVLGAPARVTEQGGGMAAALAGLTRQTDGERDATAEVVNELRALDSDVVELRVDRDEAREQLVVKARTRGLDRWLGPRSLSDGTLRFLALAVMRVSPDTGGLLCMEEPENGMHPARVPALVDLLTDIAVDPEEAVDGHDNPLRQVVLNTHSPDVVRRLDPDQVMFVQTLDTPSGRQADVRHVADTWRDRSSRPSGTITLQQVADYVAL